MVGLQLALLFAGLSSVGHAYEMTFEPPAWITSIGAQADPLLEMGWLDVTLYDGWEGHSVDPSGVLDSTVAVQQAITDARVHHLALYFPNQPDGTQGVYLISDTLELPEEHGNFATGKKACNMLFGSREGGQRPILRLAPDAVGFDDPDAPKAMLWYWSRLEYWEGDPVSTGPLDNDVDTGFDQMFRGIDLDLGGHPGAIGIKNPGAQGQAIEDVSIDARGAFAGVGTVDGLGAGEYGVDVLGGRYGVFIDKRGETVHTWNGQVSLIGFTFRDQEDAVLGFVTGDAAAPVLVAGFAVHNDGPIPFHDGYVNLGGGGLVLVDGVIDVGGGTLFDPRDGYDPVGGPDNGLLVWNVFVRGAGAVVEDWPIDDTERWTRIDLFSSPAADSWAGTMTTLVDGVLGQQVLREKTEGLVFAEAHLEDHLVSAHRWDWDTFPHALDQDAVDVRAFGAVGDGITDDRAALQAAIDQHEKVVLPKGVYAIGGPLTLRSDTKLVGVGKHLSVIIPHVSWLPETEAVMVTTASDPDGTAILTDVLIAHHQADVGTDGVLDTYDDEGRPDADQFRFTPLEWRVGRSSIVRDVVAGNWGMWVDTPEARRDYSHFKISGGGGGRWFSVLGRANWGGQDSARTESRGLVVEGTTEPLRVYPIDFAWEPYDVGIEVTEAEHVAFYQGSFEGGPRTNHRFTRSRDVAVFGSVKVFANDEQTADRAIVELVDTDDALVAMYISEGRDEGGQNHLLEDRRGETTRIENSLVSLFLRGRPGRTSVVDPLVTSLGGGSSDPAVDPGAHAPQAPDPSAPSPDEPTGATLGCSCSAGTRRGSALLSVGALLATLMGRRTATRRSFSRASQPRR